MFKNSRKKYGWAKTKKYPHASHPARYKKISRNNNDIEYFTFTHSSKPVIQQGIKLNPIALPDPIKKGDKRGVSYVLPAKFKGTRDTLGKENYEFELTENNIKKLKEISKDFEIVLIPKTGGKKRK